MAKFVTIYSRNPENSYYTEDRLHQLSAILIPDNITPKPPLIINKPGLLTAIYNPVETQLVRDTSICMGIPNEHSNRWWQPGSEIPDGSFALIRTDNESLEIATDILATRTIWYVNTEQYFITSSSQTAIIYLLQSFSPNMQVIPWMLACGNMGPGFSWDTRICCLPPDASLSISRSNWKTTLVVRPVEFVQTEGTADQYKKELKRLVFESVENFRTDFSSWMLPLSGGVDSRAILLAFGNRSDLHAVTWGLKQFEQDKKGDIFIARKLAERFNIQHDVYYTDADMEDIETIFTRYFVAGDGRVDNISGYMDGFNIWKILYENNCSGIIRGDESMGCHPVRNELDVYRNMGIELLSNYNNLHGIMEYIGKHEQHIPDYLLRKENETLEQWRDRLNQQYETPYIFAALSDLKLPYVEIINPLMTRKVIEYVRQIPDRYRTGKVLFRQLVTENSAGLGYAKNVSIQSRASILRISQVVNMVRDELNSERAKGLFPVEFLQFVISNMDEKQAIETRRQILWRRGIRKARRILKIESSNINMDINLLAFRVYLICRMHNMIQNNINTITKHQILQ